MPTRPTLALHIGSVHDGAEGLIQALRKNGELLSALGCAVHRRKYYTPRLEAIASEPVTDPAKLDELVPIWRNIGDVSAPRHACMSITGLLGSDADLASKGAFFDGAEARPTALRRYFGGEADTTFLIGIVNPATLISRAVAGAEDADQAAALAKIPPHRLSWLNVIRRIREANPDTPIVLWTREQLPFLWPRLMHMAAGIETMVMTEGTGDGLEGLLPEEAMASLNDYIRRKELVDPSALARVFDVYMKHFVKPESLSEVIHVPGWTAATVSGITQHYHADIGAIRSMDRVTVLTL